jgi:cytochrome c553
LLCATLAGGTANAQMPPLVERFCGKCHTGADAEEGLEFAPWFAVAPAALQRDAAVLEQLATVQHRLRSRTMPPDEAVQPNDTERAELAAAFAALQPIDPDAQVTTLRRLSRAQYEHTIHDLTGVVWSGKDLLPDDARTYGFDNLGDTANVTPLLFEKYFAAAASIATAMLADDAARYRLFADDAALATTLPTFLARAFRRPATAEETAARIALFDSLTQKGINTNRARTALLQSILASPAFLLREERGLPDAPARLSQHELAVRLSYTLCCSMPDEALSAAARSGELANPAALTKQAQRLLKKDDGRAFAEDFAGQWLRLRDVLTANADFRPYPQIWDGALRPAFYEEALQLFQAMVRDDLPIHVLLDADFTYANATLAKHYGLPEVQGEGFQRVPLPDRRRGGLLGMGAMLLVASYPMRTSPVLRGRWILDQLLDAPPPPPPANAGVLSNDEQEVATGTLRERLERHRRDKSCASCHNRMDPLGFPLEHYDVLGRWRDEMNGKPVDARGLLTDGTVLEGPIALKDALLARKDDFTRAMTKKLLLYAIGRPLVPADDPEIARITTAVAAGEYRFHVLLAAVVTSPLFTQRMPEASR